MSKNTDRYKDDLKDIALNEDELLEIETRSFEKFAPKKKKDKNNRRQQRRKGEDEDGSW